MQSKEMKVSVCLLTCTRIHSVKRQSHAIPILWSHICHEVLYIYIFKKYLSVAFDTFGSDRLMFGSDWPVCLLAGSYFQVLDIIEEFIAPLSHHEKDKIMGGNACKFYKL